MKRIECHSCHRKRLRKFMRRNTYDRSVWECRDRFDDNSSCDKAWQDAYQRDFIANDPWYGW